MTDPTEEQRSTGPHQGEEGPSKALLGPFTLRELVFGAGVLLVFVGTLLPFADGMVRYVNLWNSSSLFFIGIGILVPVVALALLAGRRTGGSGLRVGSLSVDQFASVSAVLAGTYFFLQTVTEFQAGPLLALLGSLGMLAATVLGPFLPVLKDDFADRPEVPAHTAARPITAARPRPARQPKPAEPVEPPDAAAAAPGRPGVEHGTLRGATVHEETPVQETADVPSAGAHAIGPDRRESGNPADTEESGPTDAAAPGTPSHSTPAADDRTRVNDVVDDSTRMYAAGDSSEERSRQEPITATRSTDEEPVVEAFWFAVGSPRPVFDEQTGREVFSLQPGDWEVGIEDRGSEFLVQDKRTGTVGILRDLRNIERAPRD